jgi:hypothetical protein
MRAFRPCRLVVALGFLTLAPLLVLASCVPTRVTDLGGSRPGQEGGTLLVNDEEFHLSECDSGDREYFLGVDLVDSSRNLIVRILVDPIAGPRLKLTRRGPDGPIVELFLPTHCRGLSADVERTGWRVNGVRDVKGNLEGECRSDSGTTLKASLHFSHCH